MVPESKNEKLSRNICLGQCLRNEFCSFVVHKNGICSLHTEYALKRLEDSNLDIVFMKNFVINYCDGHPCINNGTCVNKLDGYECLCDIGYFGTNCNEKISDYFCDKDQYRLNKSDICRNCTNGFSTYKDYFFNCYHINGPKNFSAAKSYCEEMNSFLWRPKTLIELDLFKKDWYWVEAKINYVGEPFVWPDGSKVNRFNSDEPNNLNGGNNKNIIEEVLAAYDNFFLDVTISEDHLIICQQNP
ncbi:delta and Notch-like epidermal growth factor-related receptor [Brachionus plicatilis]|uniref:Delta and Notch-like epidermal growth factor-related receptor n=1 Tax=Brachionus plicatilis TaxID=10195 RepID=A0A3M7QKC9_BRAPC|nr:delta and Notch-like epidermal growth factor-related receptor [Brachionus plicatilis]